MSLSGGEVKRIEIACILARDSQLMIFDEPEAGIDLWSFARLTETFETDSPAGQRAAVIIISHQGADHLPCGRGHRGGETAQSAAAAPRRRFCRRSCLIRWVTCRY